MRRLPLHAALALLAACAAGPRPAPEAETPPAGTAAPAEARAQDPEPWRAEPPQPAEPPDLVIPEFKRETLPNGLTLLVSELHQLPLVSINVALSAGSAQDPKGKAGLAELTHRTLLEGAGARDAIALDQAFADLGGAPIVVTRADGALVGTRVLKRNADAAAALVADVVLRPALRPADFDRKKQEHLRTLARQSGSPGYLLNWAFVATAYGAEHPYGTLTSGTLESVNGLTGADAKAFWRRHAGPKAAAIVIAGDVTMKEARALAMKHFGGWRGGAARPPVPPEMGAPGSRQVVLVSKPKLVQTLIAVGRPAIEAGHPDEAALELASTVFGGFFGSRLNMNLREAKGYSYGANAFVDPRRGEGPVMASSAVRADVTGPALREILNELEGLKARPITAAELDAAREGLIRALPGSFATVGDLASAAAGIYWEDKELDHYRKLATALERATPAQVQAAAEKYFEPSKLHVILVGDPDLVREQVGGLGLGEVQVRAPPGAPPQVGARVD